MEAGVQNLPGLSGRVAIIPRMRDGILPKRRWLSASSGLFASAQTVITAGKLATLR